MKLNIRKELHLSPWELTRILAKVGLIDEASGCAPEARVIEHTDMNQGRTLIISWSDRELDVNPSTGHIE